jgi:hypothetical protein
LVATKLKPSDHLNGSPEYLRAPRLDVHELDESPAVIFN